RQGVAPGVHSMRREPSAARRQAMPRELRPDMVIPGGCPWPRRTRRRWSPDAATPELAAFVWAEGEAEGVEVPGLLGHTLLPEEVLHHSHRRVAGKLRHDLDVAGDREVREPFLEEREQLLGRDLLAG